MNAVRLNRNESALPPPEYVLEAIRALDAESLRVYPEDAQRELIDDLASFVGTRSDEIVLANGADELLCALARAFVEPGMQAIIADPAFEMYERAIRLARGDVARVVYRRRWKIGADDVLSIAGERTRLVILGNPNNPTLDAVASDMLIELASALPNAVIVIDEVYLRFGAPSLFALARTLPNVVVVRSLSKVAGLAGLRVGYAAASKDVAAAIRDAIGPYPVGIASIVAARAYLRNASLSRAFETRLAAQVERSLDAITAVLEPWARTIWRGQANFVLVDVGERSAQFVDALLRDGIAVRTFVNPQLAGMIRVTATTDEGTESFVRSARGALRSTARA